MSKQNTIEITGKTVEEAIAAGIAELNASIGEVDVEIVEEGSKGFFGLFGTKPAKVRLSLKQSEEVVSKIENKYGLGNKAEKSEKKENKVPAKVTPSATKEEPEKKEKANKPSNLNKEVIEKRARDFLQELTKMMGTNVTIKAELKEDATLFVEMHGDELGILIGRHGETLDALQYLTRLAINRDEEDFVRVVLDSESYRAKREDALIRLANRMANRALKTGRRVSLEPMNPYERRIIHSALQAHEGVVTHSEGEEPRRHLVITLKNKK